MKSKQFKCRKLDTRIAIHSVPFKVDDAKYIVDIAITTHALECSNRFLLFARPVMVPLHDFGVNCRESAYTAVADMRHKLAI